jgi:hypothetical protein
VPKYDTEVITIEIAKLQLVGGDILVLRPDAMWHGALTHDDLNHIAEILPEGVKVMYMPRDIEMLVLSPPGGDANGD